MVVLFERDDGSFEDSAKSIHNLTDITVFAIGIGNNATARNLHIIADNKSANVFHTSDLSLNSTIEFVNLMSCGANGMYFLSAFALYELVSQLISDKHMGIKIQFAHA